MASGTEYRTDNNNRGNATGGAPSRVSDRTTGSDEVGELRRQVQQLAEQVGEHVASSAAGVLNRAKAGVADAMSGVGDKGQEAVAGVREVGDNLTRAIDESLKRRPYTTLAVAFGMGFVFALLSR
jgi:ElaB/YqjD/DUF883 family membrane-anchored ribosome-binding protein